MTADPGERPARLVLRLMRSDVVIIIGTATKTLEVVLAAISRIAVPHELRPLTVSQSVRCSLSVAIIYWTRSTATPQLF